MQRKILTALTVASAVFGGLTVLVLAINIILNYTQIGHTIPAIDLWAWVVSAVLGLATLLCAILWHKTDEPYGKKAVVVSEVLLCLLVILLLYGVAAVLSFLVRPHTSIQ